MIRSCKRDERGCFADGKCYYTGDCENAYISNGDRIRDMSNNELAEFLANNDVENICQRMKDFGFALNDTELAYVQKSACHMWLNWLSQPVRPMNNVN